MRHQVKHRRGVSRNAAAQEHVAKLRNGGVGEHTLDVVLHHADCRGKQGGHCADDRDHAKRKRRAVKQHVRPAHQVHARRHHGGRVDQRGHGRRAFHRVRQPDIQRNLRGLAGGSDEQQQRNRGKEAAVQCRLIVQRVEDLRERQRSKVVDQQEHRQQKAEVSNAIHHEGLASGVVRRRLLPIKADQQVRCQAHAFPPDKQQKEVLCQHQHQHEEHEQVQVREEAPVALVLSHITDRIKVDQEAHARDHAKHDQRQVIDCKRAVNGELPGHNPGPRRHRDPQQVMRPHEEPEVAEDERRRCREEQCNGRDTRARQAAAQRAIQHESGEGKQRQKPKEACWHREGSRLQLSSSSG